MDNISRSLILILLVLFAGDACAVYPANIIKDSYCYSDPGGVGACKNGVRFGDAWGAATYACQKGPAPTTATDLIVTSVTSAPANMAIGLNVYGKFAWAYTCTYKYNGQPYSYSGSPGSVTAEPDCGSAVTNYSPASCAGSQPDYQPPVACGNTSGAMIPAFHPVPVSFQGCYAGCAYTSVNTTLVEWNGGTYESGTWTGTGGLCDANDPALFGGAPGNAQNVSGGALGPGDLVGLAQENTLQSVLQAIQAGTTSSNSNQTILERIAAATETTAAGNGEQTVSDPDSLEAEFVNRIQSVQVDADGKLPDSALNAQTIDVGGTFSNVQGFVGVSSCPASPTFTVMGQSYSYDLSMLCTLAQALSYLVVALASMAGAKIFIGGM